VKLFILKEAVIFPLPALLMDCCTCLLLERWLEELL
jgi:hypothetical protein